MNDNKKRIIEVAFPVEEVSEQGRRDKYKNQITGIHTWWSRKPLAPSRTTAYAALVNSESHPPPTDDKHPLRGSQFFISELAKWENVLKPIWIKQAREHILESHDGIPPKVLDPFGGGGAIPLEAQRLGCETHSCDLNPVAVLAQKCTLEYPQKYGQRLYNDVKKWGERILAEVTADLQPFYPKEPDGSVVYAYIWARTLPCQNINCGAEVPLINQLWLANKKNKQIALFPHKENGQIAFRLVGTDHEAMPEGFNPSNGTVNRAVVTCPLCKSTIPAADTRRLFQSGEAGERLIAAVTQRTGTTGKQYRIAIDTDIIAADRAQKFLLEKREQLSAEWGFDPVPDEPTPTESGSGAERFVTRCPNYNMRSYGDLFNSRQQLTLVTLTEKIKNAYPQILSQVSDPEYSKAVSAYLGLWLDQLADNSSNLCRWINSSESLGNVFSGPGFIITWGYAEGNPLRIAANRLKTLLKPLSDLSVIQVEPTPTIVKQASATNLPYPDNTFDAVLTDPPYYDNVPYAYLSDFFYVWLKRSIGELFPELFKDPLTPKNDEIVAYGHRDGGLVTGKVFFEDLLSKAFQEIHRVLKPNGIAVIVYAHKTTEGWETMMNALLDSGLVITGAWPIDTEMKSRFVALTSASLSSSIYMVARKSEREPFGIYQEVKAELEAYLHEKLFTLWEYGLSGADLFIAAIGLGIEVFGKYETVIDTDDTEIRADRMIADIRELMERFDGDQAGVAGTQLTRYYLRWRRTHENKAIIFNDARELATAIGLELTEAWDGRSFIQQEGTNVRVLGPHERELQDVSNSEELIDVLHCAVLLWSMGRRAEMIECLSKEGIGASELIWNVADQIREALPTNNQERQLLDGWLADRTTIQREVAAATEVQPRDLFSK